MKHDEIERLLSDGPTVAPSSGFAAAVMDAVEREASRPPAIPFPWKHALPGIVGLTAATLATFVGFVAAAVSPVQPASSSSFWPPPASMLGTQEIGWIVFALTVTVVPVFLSLRATWGYS